MPAIHDARANSFLGCRYFFFFPSFEFVNKLTVPFPNIAETELFGSTSFSFLETYSVLF